VIEESDEEEEEDDNRRVSELFMRNKSLKLILGKS